MKKFLKFLLVIALIFTVLLSAFAIYAVTLTAKYTLDENKLINLSESFELLDLNGNKISEVTNKTTIARNGKLQDYTKNAFVAVEDKRFYNHRGIDYKSLLRAFTKNITSMSLKEGGSTISQQLIKNTHLSLEKTLKRKLVEIKLTKKLEKKYSKDEILEKYLNTIYFGHNVYGIQKASHFYFNKNAENLTLEESAVLAGMIKAPNIYSPINSMNKCLDRRNLVLKLMLNQGYITKEEYDRARQMAISINFGSNEYDYTQLCLIELSEIISNNPYIFSNSKVYTYFLPEKQSILQESVKNSINNCDKSAIYLGNFNQISAYYSTVKEQHRQVGSLLKPLGVYAPAIEENLIYSKTKILDEKTEFNGYSPSNYKEKYYGKVTVKDALSKSLNIPAVKTLNNLTIEKSISYLKKLGINLNEQTNGLSLALGGTEETFTLKDITSAYGVFNSSGNYYKPTCIAKIVSNEGKTLYEHNFDCQRVFSNETSYIISDMLEDTVKTGTAKRLTNKNATIYAKTGTNGTQNGNYDAYTVSYNKDALLGVWCGKADNSTMDNSISGGTLPATISSLIWDNIYQTPTDTKIAKPNGVIIAEFDKNEYEEKDKFVLSESIAPHSQKFSMLIKANQLNSFEKSDKYSNPVIKTPEISLNNNHVLIKFIKNDLINFRIYRSNGVNKELVFDSKDTEKDFYLDDKIKSNTKYTYSVLPYYEQKNNIYLGKETLISTIKTPNIDKELPDDWWDFDIDY